MASEDQFYLQLAKSIQAWLWVETETYILYTEIMKGAHPHLISVTFHSIESFESKLALIDSCLALLFAKDSTEWKTWRNLQNRARKLNEKRNKIVHQPVKIGVTDGVQSIEISPSFFNAQALAKGQTSFAGPTISADYRPSLAKLKDEHKINFSDLRQFETKFKQFSKDLKSYREGIQEILQQALPNPSRPVGTDKT